MRLARPARAESLVLRAPRDPRWTDELATFAGATGRSSSPTCVMMALKAARAFSDRTGAPIVTHISETKREVDDSVKAKGASPVAYLDRIGFLNNRVIAAHVVWPQGTDIAILKRHGVGVIHNPQSNMKLASGVAPVPVSPSPKSQA